MTGKPSSPASDKQARKPAAFRLDDSNVRLSAEAETTPLANEVLVTEQDTPDRDIPSPARHTVKRRRISMGRLLAIAAGGLVSLSFGLAIESLIRDLFARTDWLGWLGVGLTGLLVAALVGLVLREGLALMRLGKIDSLRDRLGEAAQTDDTKTARDGLEELIALYKDRPETAQGRRALSGHMREVIDGRDLIVLAERDLLASLDRQARKIVLTSAKRVSLVTAVSPRALIDLLVVLLENLRIIRQLSLLYGGRPGALGFLRLTKHVVAHLAITGGMAAGDSLTHDVLGHSLASRLSARLGEGVINGLLTARIGIAAIAVCRPVPFVDTSGPRVKDFMSEVMKSADVEAPDRDKA
ncbi:UPF0283 membrane protein [Roseibium aquae]|uniref:UPF0283 membrane protein n=1 Tax=Roseibium aquae TaxID=1323746 RepID=A0A916TCB3_9HYPH|nr:TIGR01620 family protein [Roseibium aquae]GGB37232.1 UPF0283 membrane protein [Roseibium aquae]